MRDDDDTKAGKALRESRFNYRTLCDNIPGMVYRGKLDWSVDIMCNSDRVCGYSVEEFQRGEVNWLDIVHPDDRKRVSEEGAKLAQHPTKFVQEYRIITKGGDTRWVEDHKTSDFGDDGAFVGINGVVFDITERKKGEDSLRESEEKFRRITEHSFDAVFTADLNGILTYASPSVTKVLGYSPEEMVGKGPAQFMAESSTEKVRHLLAEIAGGSNSPDAIEIDIWKKDGSVATVDLNAVSVRKDGKIIGVQESMRDITQRKRAEAALRESEERYRTLVESAGETIATIDRDGVYLFMNKVGAERLGGKPDDYIGKTMWDAFPKEIADRQVASVRAVIDSGQGMNVTVLTRLRGELRWYNTSIEPLRDGGGEITAALIIARDVHEIRQAEAELEAYRDKMVQAERLASLGTLSATLAHELAQPLTVIALAIENSLADLETASCPQAVTEELRDSLDEVANVTSIVERFRDFARKSSVKTVDTVNLDAVARRILKLLSKRAQNAGVALRLKGMDELPPVYLNEKDLEQLFFALVENAIQAADNHKSRGLIIDGAAKDEYIELRFSDNCGGIEPKNVDKIFEPFFTTKPPGQGTGLGLCIVQRVAERSGGKVRLENKPGEGSTFVVTLGIKENETS